MNNINFNEIPCHLKGLIFNENAVALVRKRYIHFCRCCLPVCWVDLQIAIVDWRPEMWK